MDNRIRDIQEILNRYQDYKTRVSILRDNGFTIAEKPMKGYKIGEIRTIKKTGTKYLQIGGNYGDWDYATCVILENNQQQSLF